MYRTCLCFSLLCLLSLAAHAQTEDAVQDPYAKEILDKSAEKIRSLKSIQADFTLVIEDRKEDARSISEGNILVKQEKYKLISGENTVFFDGTTMWTYASDINEVVVTEPDSSDDDFLSNPAKIFTWYSRDFKYRYVGETTLSGSKYHEIDLYPKNLDQPYSMIKVFINLATQVPEMISSIGKDGVDYTVNLKNISTDKEVADATFVFDPRMYRKVEVIDMRGIK